MEVLGETTEIVVDLGTAAVAVVRFSRVQTTVDAGFCGWEQG